VAASQVDVTNSSPTKSRDTSRDAGQARAGLISAATLLETALVIEA